MIWLMGVKEDGGFLVSLKYLTSSNQNVSDAVNEEIYLTNVNYNGMVIR